MEHIQPYLEYFSANPQWAIAVVFLIAFGEALLIIGLFVPSTAVLVGAGMLVGTGHLGFWPVFWATAFGCIAGDQVSYWAGRLYGERLKGFWPLNHYASLVVKGEEFVRSHGGKSIAIGRFVPGVKAVVPGIVGMLGMSQPFFIAVNVASGLVWTAAHLLPGVLLGQGVAIAGDLSGRLAVVILFMFVALAALGWLTRLTAAGLLSPVTRVLLTSLSRRLKRLGYRPFQRLGRTMRPEHPRSSRLLSLGLVACVCAGLLANLIYGILHRGAPSNLDLSMRSLMGEWRNAPADDLMIAVTMLGDWWVLLVMCLAMALWLLIQRSWPAAAALVVAVALQSALTFGMKALVGRQRPPDLAGQVLDHWGSFPSAHAALATLAFGMLAVIAGHNMGRWARASLISLSAMAIMLVAFSRLYLGSHWLSDVLGGVMLSVILVAAIAFVLEAYPLRRLRPLAFLTFSLLVLMAAWFLHVQADFGRAEQNYARVNPARVFTTEIWGNALWQSAPRRRIDLAGQPEDVFVAQWAGSLEGLTAAARNTGFMPQATWTWKSAIAYFDPKAAFDTVPPRPLLHEGLKARLTATKNLNPKERLVLRAYKTDIILQTAGGPVPLFLVSLIQEQDQPHFELYTMPRSVPSPAATTASLVAALRGAGNDLVAATELKPDFPQAVILAKP